MWKKWNLYILHILEEFLREFKMEDKQKKYLDKVVGLPIKSTEVGDGNWFNPPYYYPGSTSGRTFFRDVYLDTFGLLKNNSYSGLPIQLIYFKDYCGNVYGLSQEEMSYV